MVILSLLQEFHDISIGETLCEKDHILPLESIHVEEPTLSMNFIVNKSPFAGKSGKFVTSRNLKERLERVTDCYTAKKKSS